MTAPPVTTVAQRGTHDWVAQCTCGWYRTATTRADAEAHADLHRADHALKALRRDRR